MEKKTTTKKKANLKTFTETDPTSLKSAVEEVLPVKVEKLSPDAVIPTYAKNGDAGMDLTATSFNLTSDAWEYGTGLAMEIPEGYVGLIFPRSSVSKYSLSLANCVGVIDSGYRGEIVVKFRSSRPVKAYNVGDRVAQIIILPYPKVSFTEGKVSSTERGTGGFGSTGE